MSFYTAKTGKYAEVIENTKWISIDFPKYTITIVTLLTDAYRVSFEDDGMLFAMDITTLIKNFRLKDTTMFKLPKQFRHWCEIAGLEPVISNTKDRNKWRYLKDSTTSKRDKASKRSYVINSNNEFEVIHPLDGSDNTNSETTKYPIPKSEKELADIVYSVRLLAAITPQLLADRKIQLDWSMQHNMYSENL